MARKIPLLKKEFSYKKGVIALIILAIVARIALIPLYTVSGDACWHLTAARFIEENQKFPLSENLGREEPFWAPPLYHILAATFSFSFSPFGEEFGMKLISPLFGSLSLVISYLLLRRILDEKALFYAIGFFGFLPLLLDYSILGYVESVLLFFSLLSILFALKERYILSGVFCGFALLSKYNGLFVVPILLFIIYQKKKFSKEALKNALTICALPLLIGLPWLIRNYLALGNPIWPFLNFLFKGAAEKSYSALDFSSLFSSLTYVSTYLGFFGVPDGNIGTLFFFRVPLLWPLLVIFLIGTLFFAVPIVIGMLSKRYKKSKSLFFVILLVFFALFLLYVLNVGPLVSRILIPATISLAFFFGIGAEAVTEKIGKNRVARRCVPYLFIVLCLCFFFAVATKFALASNAWSHYEADFEWVKKNTPKESVFVVGGQCVQYHIDREAIYPSEMMDVSDADYLWVSESFPLDPKSTITDNKKKEILAGRSAALYRNERSGIEVYSLQ